MSQVLGKTDFELFPDELARKFAADDRRVIETGEELHDLEESKGLDGSRRIIDRRKSPFLWIGSFHPAESAGREPVSAAPPGAL